MIKGIKILSTFFIIFFLNSNNYASQNPANIFPTTKNSNLSSPDAAWGIIKKPFPTAAWFANLAIKGEGDKEAGLQPIYPAPYVVKSSAQGLGVALPVAVFAREKDSVFAQLHPYSPQLELSSTSDNTFKRSISDVSDLSVTLKYEDDQQHYMTAPIVRGAPYVTMIYHDLVPMLIPGAGIVSVNDQPPGIVVAGSRFAIKLSYDETNTQTWILYSENPITLVWKTTPQGWRLTTQASYTGWLRITLLEDTRQNVKNDAALLDQYASAIPIRGDVKYTYNDKNAAIKFNWSTLNNQPPLMMALPHHQQILQSQTTDKIKMRNSKGEMLGVVGLEWMMTEDLPKANFLEITDIAGLSNEQKNSIHNQLKKDAENIDATLDPSIYGVYSSGKRFARAARLALLADLFGQIEVKQKIIHVIESNLTTWMKGKNKWQLQYDTTWGGIIPVIDDYGSQLYNDHHFHYGYYVYTMAVLAKLDPTWLQKPLNNFTPKEWIETLIRDYANSSRDDDYLPYARHTDPFDGHAYASGLGIAFVDGRNQESVSEAVNAYYAIALLGQALNDQKRSQWGQLLLAQELRAAHTYWQILRDSKVYLPEFVKDNQITAVVWDGKVDSHTWFGANSEYTYGIEMMPFTTVTSQLLAPNWSHEAYKTISEIYKALPANNVGWKWILLKARVLGASPAEYPTLWKEAMESGIHDEGDSKTNTLFYISTFPLSSHS